MKVKFTHKEFTLLAGIIVAIIIMIAFWLQPASAEQSELSRKLAPPAPKPAASGIVKKALIVVQDLISIEI